MNCKIVSAITLALVLTGMLTLAVKIKPVSTEPRTIFVDEEYSTTQEFNATLHQTQSEPAYVGVAKYYDNRKCVVTSTHDDFAKNSSAWHECLSMFTRKKIYHTVAIITNASVGNDWFFTQHWVDQGYTEAGSHSRNHVHAPYTGTDPFNGRPRVSYEWQINGSKNDIIGNLTLCDWWRCGESEYVYAWIEPYGSCDDTVRLWLGYCHYLGDRRVGSGVYDFAGWDYSKGLFNRVGYSVEMGSPPWGGDTSVSSLNSKFDTAYYGGKIYHLITHPQHVNWSEGSYADLHTDYISNRTDVWYVPFGLLYLYHWVDARNIVNVSSTGSGLDKVFKLSIDATDHMNYGVSYPITYTFDIPSNWTSGYVYYHYLETKPWILMDNKSSEEFFNGVDASRFDFANHRAYVSIGFSNVSHNVYLRLRAGEAYDIATTNVTTTKTVVGQGFSTFINVTVMNEGEFTETFNVTAYANTTVIDTPTSITLTSGDSATIIFTWNTTGFAKGNYTIKAKATTLPGETDTTDNTFRDGWVVVTIPGDVNGDGIVDMYDLARIGKAYGSKPGNPNWDAEADINGDDIIDLYDLAISGKNYGKAILNTVFLSSYSY